MTAASDTSDTPAQPQDYAGLRAELAELANHFLPVVNELWPRQKDHKYRWELHKYRLPEGSDKLIGLPSTDCWSLVLLLPKPKVGQPRSESPAA